MSVVLLANVGTRDVDDKTRPRFTPRTDGAALLKLLEEHGGADEVAANVTLPILTPAVRYVLEQHGRVDCLVLFVTDQPATVGEEQRNKDTINSGRVIQRLLNDDLLGLGQTIPVRLEVIHEGAHNYVLMYEWFREKMPGLLREIQREYGKIEHVYVQLAGGMPACKTNLALSLLREPYQLHTLYVNERTQRVDPGNFGRVLRAAQLVELLQEYLKRDDFAAAVSLVEMWWPDEEALLGLLRGLHYRQLFRFDEAIESFGKVRRLVSDPIVDALLNNTHSVRKGAQLIEAGPHKKMPEPIQDLLADFWYHTHAAYKNERYVDFVGRFWRLREALLRYRAEMHKGELLVGWVFSQRKYFEICEEREHGSPFLVWCEQGSALQQERNKLYVGHSFRGASDSRIRELWGGTDIIDDTRVMLLTEFGVRYPTTYGDARALIMRLADELLQKE